LKLLVSVLPFTFPGSVDNSNLRLAVFSPAELSLLGTHVALGQSGMIGLAKVLTGLVCFLGIGLDIEFVMVDVYFVILEQRFFVSLVLRISL
jgi:hypothetical protein